MLKEYLAGAAENSAAFPLRKKRELWQRYAGGDQEAYNKLMTSYQPLVF